MASNQNIPVVFAFNILKNVYRQFRTQHFEGVRKSLKQQDVKVELFPVVSYERDTIESRAKIIKQNFQRILEQLGQEQVHVVTYSGSGLDFRYYIKELEGDKHVKSLTTIGSPHKGSFLAEQYMNGKVSQNWIEPVSKILGMTSFSFSELNTENILAFNSSIYNNENIGYFSIGGERLPEHCNEVLRPTGQYIFENKEQELEYEELSRFEKFRKSKQDIELIHGIPQDSDGIFSRDEIEWGTHLINFEADHTELVGIGNQYFDCSKVYELVVDNIKHQYYN